MLLAMRSARAEALMFLNAALGVWIGIHAFRSFVPTAVWNLSDALPLYAKGMLAVGVHLAGVLGCLLSWTRRPRSAFLLAAAVAITSVLRQALVGSDGAGSALSLLSWILWLWWLAAFARVARDRAQLLAPAVAVGFALQVGLQAAWHGLDLPMARGLVAIICALLLNAAFVFTAARVDAERNHFGEEAGSLFFVALGVVLFLEITLFANVGRIGFITGWPLVPAALLVQSGLLAGALLMTMTTTRTRVIVCAFVLIAVVVAAPALTATRVLYLLVAQVALGGLLAATARRQVRSTALPFALGALALFILVFLFYNKYEWPLLWIVAAVTLAVLAVVAVMRRSEFSGEMMGPRRRTSLPVLAVAVLLTGLGLIVPQAPLAPPARAGNRIATYNIHQGFDAAGVPAMQRIADEIARLDADVIALQEIGRGWTFVGGADLVAYLQYRFPQYRIHYVPLNGQLWGIALMTRLQNVSALQGAAFVVPAGAFRYGYADALVTLAGQRVRFVAVHLTAGLDGNGGGGRLDQTNQLLKVVARDSNVIIMGDLNAHPDEPPVQRILAMGYRDEGEAVGLGGIATWPAGRPNERIDYVFARGKVRAQRGVIPRTQASDHLPVVVVIIAEAAL